MVCCLSPTVTSNGFPQDTDVDPDDFTLVADLVAFGDGGFYCDRIVTPIFDVIAFEVRGSDAGTHSHFGKSLSAACCVRLTGHAPKVVVPAVLLFLQVKQFHPQNLAVQHTCAWFLLRCIKIVCEF